MRVDVSVGGLWHSPPIVELLNENDYLGKFYTTRPYFKLPDTLKNIERKKIINISWIDYVQALTIRTLKKDFQYEKATIFDRLVSKKIKPCDIFVAWSSFGVESLKKAESLGAITIIERGSAHIKEQDRLLKEVYERENIKYSVQNGAVPKKVICRELEEYDLANYIFVPSKFAFDSFVKYGIPKGKLRIVPYGINLKQNINMEVKEFNNEELKIIFVGELSLQKGISTLLNVIESIKGKMKINVIIAGWVNDYIKDRLRKNSDVVVVRGVLSKSELEKEYEKAHILILPSIQEGFGRVILEAMSYGVAIIASRNTGAPDIIKNEYNGFLFDVYDEKSIENYINLLYNDRELLEKVCYRSMETIKDFSIDIYKKNILKEYESIIGRTK